MYQGKFSSENRAKAVAERNARMGLTEEETPVAAEEELLPEQEPELTAEVTAEVPAEPEKKAKKAKKDKKEKRKNGAGSVIFYTLYFLLIAAAVIGMFFLRNWLLGWLQNYQASQPSSRSEEVFQEYFGDPDWNQLYDLAGFEDTLYEGKDAYVAYMTKELGSDKLSFMEVSAGLSGDHKYVVKLGDKNLGHFTLTDKNADKGDDLELPDWQLGEISLSVTRNESVMLQKMDGHKAFVNGIEVDDSHTVQIGSTIAERYLPEGTTGFRLVRQQVDGLLTTPVITVTDSDGNPSTVIYDEEKGMYVEQTEETTISDEEMELTINAAQAYGLFMIDKASSAKLATYFVSTSDIYKTIARTEKWLRGVSKFNFSEEDVTDYVRYSEKLFSVRYKGNLNLTRTNGFQKAYEIDSTLFFEKQKNGSWKAYDMTNVDVSQQISQVRLTFLDTDGEQVSSGMYADDSSELYLPVLSVPSGKVFAGWFTKTVAENGSITMQQIFEPDAEGHVTIPTGVKLEPMVLYPVFEDAAAQTNNESEAK